jgi:methylmalonyl-CoA/ethylmalonyl-CoA epimerase
MVHNSSLIVHNSSLMKHIEHIGIAVKNLEFSNELFTRLLGSAPYKQEGVESEGVMTSFFQTGQTKIELLEATNPDSPIAKFIEKKGEGIHHIAFEVEDIVAEMKRLKSEGFILLNEVPKKGADNKLVCFLHPKGTNSVLIELCQGV